MPLGRISNLSTTSTEAPSTAEEAPGLAADTACVTYTSEPRGKLGRFLSRLKSISIRSEAASNPTGELKSILKNKRSEEARFDLSCYDVGSMDTESVLEEGECSNDEIKVVDVSASVVASAPAEPLASGKIHSVEMMAYVISYAKQLIQNRGDWIHNRAIYTKRQLGSTLLVAKQENRNKAKFANIEIENYSMELRKILKVILSSNASLPQCNVMVFELLCKAKTAVNLIIKNHAKQELPLEYRSYLREKEYVESQRMLMYKMKIEHANKEWNDMPISSRQHKKVRIDPSYH